MNTRAERTCGTACWKPPCGSCGRLLSYQGFGASRSSARSSATANALKTSTSWCTLPTMPISYRWPPQHAGSKGGSRARIAVPTYSWRTNNTGIWGGPVPGSCASPGFVPHVMRSTAAGGRISMTTWRQFDSLIRSSRHRPLTSGPPSCADARYLPMSRRW